MLARLNFRTIYKFNIITFHDG